MLDPVRTCITHIIFVYYCYYLMLFHFSLRLNGEIKSSFLKKRRGELHKNIDVYQEIKKMVTVIILLLSAYYTSVLSKPRFERCDLSKSGQVWGKTLLTQTRWTWDLGKKPFVLLALDLTCLSWLILTSFLTSKWNLYQKIQSLA